LFGVRPVWIGAVKEDGVTRVTFASAGVETPGPEVTGKTLDMRAEVTPDQMVRFSYSADGRTFTTLGEPVLLSKFSWWKGSRPGLFTYVRAAPGTAVSGHVDIDFFRVMHDAKP
jgi:hypothetical protein